MRVYRYKLPLTQAIRLGERTVRHREGVLLEADGGWAEAAPLPNFSKETVSDVIQSLRGNCPAPPSVQFALDSLSNPQTACELTINALLQGPRDQMIAKCRKLSTSACCAVKVKVGRQQLQEEVELIHELRTILRTDQRLRLDANRAWDFHTAFHFATALSGIDIEYIEEPLQDYLRLDEFALATELPYALDETLIECESLQPFGQAAACIIKPTLLGSHRRLESIANLGKPLVFSACYESGIGIARIAQLAATWSPQLPAGFDTYPILTEDVIEPRLEIRDWRIHVPDNLHVKTQFLQEVSL